MRLKPEMGSTEIYILHHPEDVKVAEDVVEEVASQSLGLSARAVGPADVVGCMPDSPPVLLLLSKHFIACRELASAVAALYACEREQGRDICLPYTTGWGEEDWACASEENWPAWSIEIKEAILSRAPLSVNLTDGKGCAERVPYQLRGDIGDSVRPIQFGPRLVAGALSFRAKLPARIGDRVQGPVEIWRGHVADVTLGSPAHVRIVATTECFRSYIYGSYMAEGNLQCHIEIEAVDAMDRPIWRKARKHEARKILLFVAVEALSANLSKLHRGMNPAPGERSAK